MSQFTTHASVYAFKAADTGQWTWAVNDPLIWEVRDAEGNVTDTIVAEQGFYTDLGTHPWWIRWLLNPADPQCVAAFILHDRALPLWGPERQLEAAGLAYQAMKALDVARWRRKLLVAGIIAGIDRW